MASLPGQLAHVTETAITDPPGEVELGFLRRLIAVIEQEELPVSGHERFHEVIVITLNDDRPQLVKRGPIHAGLSLRVTYGQSCPRSCPRASPTMIARGRTMQTILRSPIGSQHRRHHIPLAARSETFLMPGPHVRPDRYCAVESTAQSRNRWDKEDQGWRPSPRLARSACHAERAGIGQAVAEVLSASRPVRSPCVRPQRCSPPTIGTSSTAPQPTSGSSLVMQYQPSSPMTIAPTFARPPRAGPACGTAARAAGAPAAR